ncbi:Do family serine endopeptidase [Novosphingobium ginsenosidimutans]|uniref:Probable periplasmic serine endoprotease DegP-like n=2 Tax=Novosphingobium ginsenosidimutans TaxID=1176536 RepID=A0A5B8S8T8_9SPHN|nr:Do family serine endopeptidase [Novosphingobium ginsenosidimutans]
MEAMVPRAGAPASFAELTQQLQPAVVNIATRQRVRVANGNPFAGTPFEDLFGGGGGGATTREAQSLGSGFIISADGYVVTNNHVITADGQGEVQSITVTLSDGSEHTARLIGRDAQSDLAVLKIDAGKTLPFVKFGNSEAARVGDWVIAIGNPFGLGGTVTSGIVSAVHRSSGASRYIQTDASINRGNSGGPLFDMKGNVIGINNAIFSPTGGNVGIGFAIPADIASPIVDKLMRGQAIERGYLGVQIVPVTEDVADSLGLARNRGELVQTVQPGQAAASAGLQPGDVVVKVDGQEVSPDNTLSFIVANTAPGKRIPIEVIRNGKRMTLTATVGKRPSEEELAKQTFAPGTPDQDDRFNRAPEKQGEGLAERALGLSVLPMTPQIAGQIGLPADTRGLVISVVDGSSDAGAKGLQRGDVILSANYRDVLTVADLEAIIRSAKAENRAAVLLRVQRRGQPAAYLPVRLR